MDSQKARSLVWLGEHTAYLPGGVNSGIIINDNKEAVIIDTGLDSSSGNKILRALEQEGIKPIAIANTHSHADHFGGNATILRKISLPVYATLAESSNIQNPVFEPFYLYGANPPKEMKSKFLMADSSIVSNIIDIEANTINIKDIELKIFDFSGHSPGMIGIGYEEEALFLGDNLFPKAIVEKYPVIYCYDVEKTLSSLEKLMKLLINKQDKVGEQYKYFVPAHGKPSEMPIEDIQVNVEAILKISEYIFSLIENPCSREEIVSILFDKYGISENMPQYYLTSGSVGAHLTYLMDKDKVNSKIDKGILKFFRGVIV